MLVTGGPQLNGNWRGEDVGSCTDCRRYQTELRAGRITAADWAELQGCILRSPGHCMTMGTASTMACIAEAGPPEGDYQDWDTKGKYKTMDSLTLKAAELLHRRQRMALAR